MTESRERFLKCLGISEMPELYGKNFFAVMEEYDTKGVWFLKEEFLDNLQESLAVFSHKYEFVKKSMEQVRKNELLARHSLLLYHMLADREPETIIEISASPKAPSEALRIPYEMSAFFAQLAFAPEMADFFRAHEVPEKIFLHTIRNTFEGSLNNYSRLFQKDGFEADRIFNWNQRLLNHSILPIGVLNFEMRKTFVDAAVVLRNQTGEIKILAHNQPISENGMVAGSAGAETAAFFASFRETEDAYEGYPVNPWQARVLPEKISLPKSEWEIALTESDPVISVHIPRGKDFTPENLEASYAECLKIFSHCFPEYRPKAFFCHSWLMEPKLRDFLRPTSNILAFQNKYLRFPHKSDGRPVLTFLFEKPNIENLEELPENSSLQRAVKAHYLDGRFIYEPCGIFFFDNIKQ